MVDIAQTVAIVLLGIAVCCLSKAVNNLANSKHR